MFTFTPKPWEKPPLPQPTITNQGLNKKLEIFFLPPRPPPPLCEYFWLHFTGIVSVMLSNSLCKDGNALLKASSDQVWIRYPCYQFKSWLFSIVCSLQNLPNCWTAIRLNTFKPLKIQYLPHYYSAKGFKNTFAVPLSLIKIQIRQCREYFVSYSKSVKDWLFFNI